MRCAGLLLVLPIALVAQTPRSPSAPAPTAATTTATPPTTAPTSAMARRATIRGTSRYDDIFRRYSKRYFGPAFDWRWIKAQAMAESNLDPNARSYVGARGLMQLMPATYQGIQSRRPEFGAIDDPEWNIAAGVLHDRHLWRLWERAGVPDEERYAFMFGSYNAGEGTIRRAADSARVVAGGRPNWDHVEIVAPRVPRWRYRETLGYVRRIDTTYAWIRRQR